MTDKSTHLVVIGAGPGGYTAAFLAADMGMTVTLVDPAAYPGGVCLYRGCIPSKALLHVASLIHEAAAAESCGISFGKPKIDIERMGQWKSEVVTNLTSGLGRLVAQRNITYLRATATFVDPQTLALTDSDGKTRSLGFEHAIVASGSRAVDLDLLPANNKHIWNSRNALDLEMVPESLLVVGGGYIGLELGSVYAALGADVTVVEMLPHLLEGVDRDLIRFLKKTLTTRFKAILTDTTVESASIQKSGVDVTLRTSGGQPQNQSFQRVLVAVGRRPFTEGLGLEKAGVNIRENGFVKTDQQCRTSVDTIFAIGDVASQPMLAHKASYEARIAVETIAGKNVIADPAAIPAVVFTDPEIAWVGLSETTAQKKGINVEVTRFPWAASGRAMTLGRSDGLTKLVVDPESKRLLGAGFVGPGAGELIAEATLALEMAANTTDLGLTIHPHPTLSETLKEAADMIDGTATHYFRPKRKKKEA